MLIEFELTEDEIVTACGVIIDEWSNGTSFRYHQDMGFECRSYWRDDEGQYTLTNVDYHEHNPTDGSGWWDNIMNENAILKVTNEYEGEGWGFVLDREAVLDAIPMLMKVGSFSHCGQSYRWIDHLREVDFDPDICSSHAIMQYMMLGELKYDM